MTRNPRARSIRRYEELSLCFWPPESQILFDGWVVGMSDGYTRRANCTVPLYQSALEVRGKILQCQTLYQRAGLPPCFKLTEAAEPPGLDGELAARGYAFGAQTSVQLAAPKSIRGPDHGVSLSESSSASWLDSYARLHGLSEAEKRSAAAILDRIRARTCFASIGGDAGTFVACGLCALQADTAGLFAIAVDPRRRREGLGRLVTTALAQWAAGSGAERLFLQVTVDNEPARALYAQLGFTEHYRYWYRTLAAEPFG